jgi:hypothetical protein
MLNRINKISTVMLLVTGLLSSCRPVDESGSSLTGLETDEHFKAEDWTTSTGHIEKLETLGEELSRKPVVIYYAVDGEEPFMQAAVDYSVRSLREACAGAVNWIAFLNSHYVYNSEKYLKCVDGKYSEMKLNGYFDKVIDVVAKADNDPSKASANGLNYDLKHDKKFNKFFDKKSRDDKKVERYPLAHPEVFALALKKTRAIFAPSEHVYFLHVYSHGAEEFVLTGLTEAQLNTKTERQNTAMKTVLDSIGKSALDDKDPANVDGRNRVACESKGAKWTGRACYCAATKSYLNQFFGTCNANVGYAGLGNASVREFSLATLGLGRQLGDVRSARYSVGQQGVGQQGVGQQGLGQQGVGQQGVGQQGVGQQGVGQQGVGQQGVGQQGVGQQGVGQQGVGQQGVGQQGVGQQGVGQQGVGQQGVGQQGIGFDDVGQAGLGANGVGVDNHFGTPHKVFLQVLKDAGAKNMKFAHVFLEACNTKIGENSEVLAFLKDKVTNVHTLYSAKGNMWYRNMDWNLIIDEVKDSNDQARVMLDIVLGVEETMPNYVKKKVSK